MHPPAYTSGYKMDVKNDEQSKFIALHAGIYWSVGVYIIKDGDVVNVMCDSKKMYEAYEKWPEIAQENYFSTRLSKIQFKNIDHIVFAGVGGSGTISDVISSILSKNDIHVNVVKGYLLPKTVDSNTMIISTSVSGNSKEALTVLQNAKKSKTR